MTGFGFDLGPIHVSDHGVDVHPEVVTKWAQGEATALTKDPLGYARNIAKSAAGLYRLTEGVVSLVPGIGTGLSSAIEMGVGLLDGGSPLEMALHAAYGAIPIPAGLRTVTDAVLDAVLALVHGGNVTDAILAAARGRIPSGMPRDVFDSLAHVVMQAIKPNRPTLRVSASHAAQQGLTHVAPASKRPVPVQVKNAPVKKIPLRLPPAAGLFPGAPASLRIVPPAGIVF